MLRATTLCFAQPTQPNTTQPPPRLPRPPTPDTQVKSMLGKGGKEVDQTYNFFTTMDKEGNYTHKFKPSCLHVTGGLLNRQPTDAATQGRADEATAAFGDGFGKHCGWCGERFKPLSGTEDEDTHLWCGSCKRNRSRKPQQYAAELWPVRPFTACGPTACEGCTAPPHQRQGWLQEAPGVATRNGRTRPASPQAAARSASRSRVCAAAAACCDAAAHRLAPVLVGQAGLEQILSNDV